MLRLRPPGTLLPTATLLGSVGSPAPARRSPRHNPQAAPALAAEPEDHRLHGRVWNFRNLLHSASACRGAERLGLRRRSTSASFGVLFERGHEACFPKGGGPGARNRPKASQLVFELDAERPLLKLRFPMASAGLRRYGVGALPSGAARAACGHVPTTSDALPSGWTMLGVCREGAYPGCGAECRNAAWPSVLRPAHWLPQVEVGAG